MNKTDNEIRQQKRAAAKRRALAADERIKRQNAKTRDWRNNSTDAARRYINVAKANGRTAATAGSRLRSKQIQATKHQQSEELAKAKAYYAAQVKELLSDV